PVSAPSLDAGKSAELVREEIASTTAADAMMISMDDVSYPPRVKEVHDPPLILRVRSNLGVLTSPGIAMLNTRPSLALRFGEWPSAWPVTWPRRGGSLLVVGCAAWRRPAS